MHAKHNLHFSFCFINLYFYFFYLFLYYNGQSAELPWVVAAVVVDASRSPDHCHSRNDWGNRW